MEPNHNVYIKSTTVYVPSSKLGLYQPLLSPASVPLPPERGRGKHTRLRVRGWFRRQQKKLSQLCLLNHSMTSKFDPVRDFNIDILHHFGIGLSVCHPLCLVLRIRYLFKRLCPIDHYLFQIRYDIRSKKTATA
jgi:hypothetical protein